ncbi:MAG: flagellin [Phycisphaeraceae bacterium]
MSRINNNINSLIAQRVLGSQNTGLSKSLERLSTGLAINRGADNPAGLIASEKLRSEKVATQAAIGNAQRADQISNIAEGGLQEINSQLLELQSLVSETANSAGLSTAEKEANQQQVDAILQSIDRIASTTSFAGTKLLNGAYDFVVSGQSASVADFQVNGAKITHDGSVAIKALVTASAQHAGLFLSTGATALNLSASTAKFTFEVTGAQGTREFSFASGTNLSAVAANINSFKSITGVSAKSSANGIVLKTEGFGSDQFVSFKVTNNGGQLGSVFGLATTNENASLAAGGTAYIGMTNAIRDEGQDIGVIVNGISARGKGKVASVNTDALDLSLELTTTASQTLANVSAFTITGGGATFNIGQTVDVGNQVRLGIRNVAARNLGSTSQGFLGDLGSGKTYNLIDGNLESSQKIVNQAIDQVSALRGRLGSFQKNVIGSTINALSIALENTSAAESSIRDTDFAKETANLTRNQILAAAASNVLSIANSQPQSVLQLLG